MDYTRFRNPSRPDAKTSGGTGSKTVKASLRVASFLWDTTVPNNPFGTDGPGPAPEAWPGDTLRKCRQWHGLDLSFRTQDGRIDPGSVVLVSPAYSATTETCGIIGKTTTTDRHVTEPVVDADVSGRQYVEVKTLLGTRLGAFIPDLDVGLPGGSWEQALLQHGLEEFIEQMSEEKYMGTDTWAPKIFSYARLRVYATGGFLGRFVSKTLANGFVTQEEIIDLQLACSCIPEHHLYMNGKRTDWVVPASDAVDKWVDSGRPADAFAFLALSAALKEWCAGTPLSEKKAFAKEMKAKYPDYFVGTEF
jgi:hypothetical protein